MDEVNQATVKTVNVNQAKIDVVTFDSTSNFNMWRCKVMDALTASNFKDVLLLENKPEEISEQNWDKMNRTASGVIRSCLIQDLKHHVINKTSAK